MVAFVCVRPFSSGRIVAWYARSRPFFSISESKALMIIYGGARPLITYVPVPAMGCGQGGEPAGPLAGGVA